MRTERFEVTSADAQAGRSVSYACEHRLTVAPPRRPIPIGKRALAGIAAALVLGGGAIGYVMREGTPPRRAHSVTIPINPAATAPTGTAASAPMAARPMPIAPRPRAPAGRAAQAEAARSPDASAAIDAAIVTAFATNEMQSWESGEKTGLIVVGPAAIAAGVTCRDVAILTRFDGAKDMTANSRRCQSRDGHMLPAQGNAPAAAPPPGVPTALQPADPP